MAFESQVNHLSHLLTGSQITGWLSLEGPLEGIMSNLPAQEASCRVRKLLNMSKDEDPQPPWATLVAISGK